MRSMTWRRLVPQLPRWAMPVVLLAGLVFALDVPLAAQQVPEIPAPGEALYEFFLADGSQIVARVGEVGDSMVILFTPGGTRLEVDLSQIREIRPAAGRLVNGEFWREDANKSRLFFTATGRSLAAGEAYAGTYLIMLPFVAVGVTDRFTLAAGAPVLFGEFEPFYVAPKLQVLHSPRADISIGSLIFFYDDENVGIAYGVGTFGDADRALTLGLGFGFSGADFSSQPVAMIGGEARVGRRTKLVTENYFLPGETGVVLSGGLRFIGQRFSTDVGVAGAVVEDVGWCCAPIVNFSYAFGRGR